jgi:divalent metal cation (Fe/Co/Zn/Cd) transporter
VALTLVYESRGLLIGESTNPEVVADIRKIAAADPTVSSARTPLTMHLAPFEILLNLEVVFKQDTPAVEQVAAVERIEKAIREKYPSITRIFIEARRGEEPRPASGADPRQPVRTTQSDRRPEPTGLGAHSAAVPPREAMNQGSDAGSSGQYPR